MAQNNINDKIESYINDIPSLPVSVGKVMEVCNVASVNPSDINKVISLDPVLTGRVLKLINSAYYGLNTHVTSLIKAITMLGINTVKNLALSTAILSALPKNKGIHGLDMEGYWRHCLSVGVISKLLAIKQGIDPVYHQEYFTAGLLHDIGKIPINAVLSADYLRIVSIANHEHKPLFIAENENLGTNHNIVGEMIASAWKLDSPVYDVIAWHHNIKGYSGKNFDILFIIAVANYFSVTYEVGFAGNMIFAKPADNIWKTIGLSEDSIEEIKIKVSKEIEKAKIFLKI